MKGNRFADAVLFVVVAFVALLAVLFLAALLLAQTAHAAPAPQNHQVIGGVWLHQNSREAEFDLSTVDAGPFRHVTVKQIKRGIRLVDDSGRVLAFKGKAVIEWQDRHAQTFHVSDFTLIKGGKKVRIAHFHLGLFSGDDWEHPYETSITGSPSMSVAYVLSRWIPGD